ncbi:sugar ABC transporter permease [Virgisporangium ochraceum]|uniref:Sugar ABC transporter permease n=1 Tax=Virgisporangium ochraceum TaxID=65505 RepID=A0A8J4EBE2_9ACTN|nr:sugar ABC transporter permease [Virgisporangium ochraceum]GIJ68368.1 sugar ABC transporter permease [Virgisporangium ochraceum]
MALKTAPPSTVDAPAPARRRRRADRSAWWAFLLLTAPLVIGLLVFKYVAMAWGLLLSFSQARGTIALGTWVGFANYATLFEDPQFRKSLTMIVAFTVIIVPLTFAISLGLAVLVNRLRRGRAFFRTTFFLPAAVSYVVASLVWKMSLFSGVPSSAANSLAGLFGQEPTAWIATVDPPLYWVVLVTVRLWLQVGLYMILFLAGIQDIPNEMYEAARVDGASGEWKLFRHITFPLLRNTSVAVTLLLVINAFQAFDEFYNLLSTGLAGGPGPDGRPPLVYLYDLALAQQNYGVGSAGAFVVTLLIVVVTLLQSRAVGFGKGDGE